MFRKREKKPKPVKIPKHKHEARAVRCSSYHSIAGPRTVVSVACSCGRTGTINKTGEWRVEDFRNTLFLI